MFIDERAEIEEMYAKKLRTWSKKWKELIEKGIRFYSNDAVKCNNTSISFIF